MATQQHPCKIKSNDLTVRTWTYSMRADNKSDNTIRSYIEGVRMFEAYLIEFPGDSHGDVLDASTNDVRRFIGHLSDTKSANTAGNRYRALQQFYKWAVAEEMAETNPMDKMKPPKVPEILVPVVSLEDLKKLLKACEGKDFLALRDTALIRLMLEPGGTRRAEIVNLGVDGVDLEDSSIVVVGKGRRERRIPYGAKTGRALTRYLRVRASHAHASSNALWLAQKGPLTDNGLGQMLERRCAQAGIEKIHPHQLRHTAAHEFLAESGGDETSAMRLFGWKSRQMLGRYAASTADERAQAQARRLNLGDRL